MQNDKITALERAFSAAIQCEGIGGSNLETFMELEKARKDCTTFFGTYENNLRGQVDCYIEFRSGGVR